MKSRAQAATAPRTATAAPSHRWLLLVHQLPASPSNLRVRTWRRLQQIGAVPVKQALYVLPDSPNAREDFEWLKAEVKDAGGEASVFSATSVDTWSDDALVEAFRRSRQEAYGALAGELERLLTRLNTTRRRHGTRRPAVGRLVDRFRERLSSLEHIDFFGSAGRDRVVWLLRSLEERAGTARSVQLADSNSRDRSGYADRLWVTRPRPGVDRMSSAWLIRRFIDSGARFAFAADSEAVSEAHAIPFDMFGVEFSHRGDACTFETLCTVFGIEDSAVARIAQIVHDLDLRDGRFGASEATTVGTVIDGLQLATADDDTLLERGITLFESLFCAFEQSARTPGPRPLAKSGVRSTKAVRRRSAVRRRGR